MKRAIVTIWLVAQLGSSGRPESCWVVRNVAAPPDKHPGTLHYLNRDQELEGRWLIWVEPKGGKLEEGAKVLGLPLSKCQG